uniref:Ribosome biogenesis protein NOP53 n=1 Tax=Culicoides sonorensis TaxID=179676 RepID=A0A336LMN0_CULSO
MATKTINKKKHHSRKLKSSWRKHVDITDVENYLEEKRADEIIGTVSDKQDDELFAVDSKPDQALVKLTPKQLRKLKAKETPKSFAILENQSQVKDPITKRNRVKSKDERKHPLVKKKEELKAAEGKVPTRLIKAQEQRKAALQAKAELRKKKAPKFDADLWADENSVPKELNNEWYNKTLVEHNLKGLGKPKVRLPGELRQKRSKLKAVQPPHPGLSYNPTFDDHQELIEEVVKKEETIIKKREHLERVLTNKMAKMTRDQIEKMKQKELIQGLPIDHSKENKEDEEPSDDEYKTVNPPVRNKKKDRKARRKQKEQREKELLEKTKKRELKKVKDINNVPELKKQITVQEKVVEKKRVNQAEREKLKKTSALRISKVKYREPEIDVNELEDISGNLRNLKPAGNLLLDRFKSLQKRNILPSTLHRKRKMKTMVKKYIKQSHKGEGLRTKNYIKPPKSSR